MLSDLHPLDEFHVFLSCTEKGDAMVDQAGGAVN